MVDCHFYYMLRIRSYAFVDRIIISYYKSSDFLLLYICNFYGLINMYNSGLLF